jgi:hypothetical protein
MTRPVRNEARPARADRASAGTVRRQPGTRPWRARCGELRLSSASHRSLSVRVGPALSPSALVLRVRQESPRPAIQGEAYAQRPKVARPRPPRAGAPPFVRPVQPPCEAAGRNQVVEETSADGGIEESEVGAGVGLLGRPPLRLGSEGLDLALHHAAQLRRLHPVERRDGARAAAGLRPSPRQIARTWPTGPAIVSGGRDFRPTQRRPPPRRRAPVLARLHPAPVPQFPTGAGSRSAQGAITTSYCPLRRLIPSWIARTNPSKPPFWNRSIH